MELLLHEVPDILYLAASQVASKPSSDWWGRNCCHGLASCCPTQLALGNNSLSQVVALIAELHQGCSLTPIFYLIAAQAPLCWLQHYRVESAYVWRVVRWPLITICGTELVLLVERFSLHPVSCIFLSAPLTSCSLTPGTYCL